MDGWMDSRLQGINGSLGKCIHTNTLVFRILFMFVVKLYGLITDIIIKQTRLLFQFSTNSSENRRCGYKVNYCC